MKFLPSTHTNHLFDDTCQWTLAAQRQSTTRVLPKLRDPKTQAAVAPDVVEPDHTDPPPPVDGMPWFPVIDLHTLSTLDTCQQRDGWHHISSDDTAQTWTNGRLIRSSEPRSAHLVSSLTTHIEEACGGS